MNILREFDFNDWNPDIDESLQRQAMQALEAGQVIFLPRLAFELKADEQRFLSPEWSDGKAKNISLRTDGEIKGARGSVAELAALHGMVQRYADQALQLVSRLFPHYVGKLQLANTSYRPCEVENRISSYRKDDTRLHTDAFPSNPTHGTRLLRVFTNVNPHGRAREWRLGEPFPDMAAKYLPFTRPMFLGQAWLMHKLGITKKPRSQYDHLMLQLHDRVKADLDYQHNAPQQRANFMPGTTWVVYSDQVLHAAMSGQYMLEQTFHLPVEALHHPQTAPIRVLEHMLGKPLGPTPV